MTSTAKTAAATDLTLTALQDGETADASDVTTPFEETEDNIDEARETVSVTANDTHVKNLDDALTVASPLTKTTISPAGDEALQIGAGTKLTGLEALLASDGKVQDGTIDSETATNGYVLTANGSGGASWASSGAGTSPVDVEGTAGENLALRDMVFLDESDQQWYKIDIDADPPLVGRHRGCVTEAGGITASATGTIRILGEVSGFTGLTAFEPVWAHTTAGSYTQTKPTLSKGGAQQALVQLGIATSTTAILVLPLSPCRFMKRADLAQDGTMTLKHYTDTAEQTRDVLAFISSTGPGSQLATYADTNQDDGEAIQGPTFAGDSIDTNASGTISYIGDVADDEYRQIQTFTTVNGGELTQFVVSLGANTGSPTGDINWAIVPTAGGTPDDTTILQSGSFTPTPSADNTINTSGLVLEPATMYGLYLWAQDQSTNDRYNWVSQSTSSYAGGAKWQSDDGGSTFSSETRDNDLVLTLSATSAYSLLAQGFQVTGAQTVGSIKLYLKKTGSPTGNLTVKIYDDSGGDPDSLVTNATSDTVAASALSTSYSWIEFTFSTPPSLTGSTQYHIRLETADSQSDTDYVTWGTDSSTPSYADGEFKIYDGSWASASADGVFEVLSEGTSYDEPIDVGSWTLEESKIAARFDDGSGSNATTQTTIKNLHTATLDVTGEIRLP